MLGLVAEENIINYRLVEPDPSEFIDNTVGL